MSQGAAITLVRSPEDIAAAIDLGWQFFEFAKVTTGDPEEVEGYLRDHQVREKFADFGAHFLPPKGDCLLARLDDGTPVGTVMLTTKAEGRCEMNRMFVHDKARGTGLGKDLCAALIARAKDMGFTEITLDTLKMFEAAIGLYRSVGFEEDLDPDRYAANDERGISMKLALVEKAAEVTDG